MIIDAPTPELALKRLCGLSCDRHEDCASEEQYCARHDEFQWGTCTDRDGGNGCSAHGVCSTAGECECYAEWEGKSCEWSLEKEGKLIGCAPAAS